MGVLLHLTCISIVACFKISSGQQKTKNFVHKTKLGAILGVEVSSYDTTELYRFLQIPYAQPPIGRLRFTKPRPYGSWNGTLNATAFGPACPQVYNYHFVKHGLSEDCLHLNIYAPPNLKSLSKKSVMVWIHGGSYSVGTASFYDGSMLAKTGNVIVVTVNYRLGLLGFLALKKSTVKGNYGLWDQMMALQWVKDNIDDYGGDTNSITIFGQSAGGFSVGFLALIPQNEGLFHRVIMQSGVPNSSLKVTRQGYDTYSTSEAVSVHLCPFFQENILMRIICMRYLPTSSYTYPSSYIPLAPVVDNDLFQQSPEEILKDQNSSAFAFFKSLDVIVTNCDTEGSVLFPAIESLERYYKKIDDSLIPSDWVWNVGPEAMLKEYYGRNKRLFSEIGNFYGFTKNSTSQDQFRRWTELFTDLFFIAPSTEIIDIHSNNKSSTFRFILSRESPIYPGVMYNESAPPEWFHGAAHSDDVVYLFLIENLQEFDPNTTVKATEEDLLYAFQMRKYWSNFAITGNPNDPRLPFWPRYNIHNKSFIQLGDNISSKISYKSQEADFWLHEIPYIQQQHPVFSIETSTHYTSSAKQYNFKCEITFLKFFTMLIFCYFVRNYQKGYETEI
ncbi:acetylcholinesterase-like [Saccostrea echinata]|uniref:acetylcholinesterase-like n=1 Tax=Saccostrea echinata TaxID=191078 RepID=UPI002A7F2BAD|nr:acetylcholinesterase-like [Saccostrea echinata]